MSSNPRLHPPALVEPLDPRRLLSTTPLPDLTLNAVSLLGDQRLTYNPGDTLFPVADAACAGGPSRVVTVAYALSADDTPGNADDIPLSSHYPGTNTALTWAHNPLDTTDVPPPLAAFLFDIPATTPAGTYHLVATIDPDNAVPESDESNNALLGPTISIAPHSTVAESSGTDNSVPDTDPVTVTDPVTNPLPPASSAPTTPSATPGSKFATTLHLTNPTRHRTLARRTVKTYFSTDARLSRNDTLFSTCHLTYTPLRHPHHHP